MLGVVRRGLPLFLARRALRVEDLGGQPVGVGLAHGVDVDALEILLVGEAARGTRHATAVGVDVETRDVVFELDELVVDLVLDLPRRLAGRCRAHIDELARVFRHVHRGVGGVVANAGRAAHQTHAPARHGTRCACVEGLLVVQVVGDPLALQAVLCTLTDQVLSKFRAKFTSCAAAHRLDQSALDTSLCQRFAGAHGHSPHGTRHEAFQGRLEGARGPCGVEDLVVPLGGPDRGVQHDRTGRLVGHLVVTGQGGRAHRPKLSTLQTAGGEATHQPAGQGGHRRLDRAAHVAQGAHGPLRTTGQVIDVGEPADGRCPGLGQLGRPSALGLQLLACRCVAGLVGAGRVPQEFVGLLAQAGRRPAAGELARRGCLQGLIGGEVRLGVVHPGLRGRSERRHCFGAEVSHHLSPFRKNFLNAAFSSSVRLLYCVVLMWSPWSVTKPPRRPVFCFHWRMSVPPRPA